MDIGKVSALDQSPAFKISLRDTPLLYAEDSEAPLYEWAKKTLVSSADNERIVLSHLARDTSVTGFIVAQDENISSWFSFVNLEVSSK